MIIDRSASRKVLCQIPTNFRPYTGWYYVALLLVIREAIANAITYATAQPEMRVWWIRLPNGNLYLVIGHNGKGFGSEREIWEKGHKPLQSGDDNGLNLKKLSLNGSGLTFGASLLAEDGELIILSQVKNGEWYGYRSFPDRAANQWVAEECPEWLKIIRKHFGEQFFKKFTVCYAFRLNESRCTASTAPLKETHINMLTFMAPSFVGKGVGHRWTPAGATEIDIDTAILQPNEKYDWGGSGSARRIVPPLGEFLESYCDGEFEIPIEPFTFELNRSETVRISATLNARAYPTEKHPTNNWLMRIRNSQGYKPEMGKNPPKGCFAQGSGSSPGAIPAHLVYLTMSCLAKKGPKFERFSDNSVWSADGPSTADYMSACGFLYSSRGYKFATLLFDITAVEKLDEKGNWVPMEPMQFAARLEREADFTFRSKIVRDIVLEACDHLEDCSEYQAAKARFEEIFPREEGELISLFVQDRGLPKEKEQVFDIYDLSTGEKLVRECEDGHTATIVIPVKSRKFGKKRVQRRDIAVPPSLENSFSITEPKRLTAVQRENLAKLEEQLGQKLDPMHIEISYLEYRKDEDADWKPIKNVKTQYQVGGINCRPRRNLWINIANDWKLHLLLW